MGCIGNCCKKILVGILSLIKVGVCIAIICIISLQLWDISWKVNSSGKPVSLHANCLMAGDVEGSSVCEYAYAVCGLSMLLSFVTSILLCVTCDMCGLGSWIEFIVSAFQTVWWVVAAIIITNRVKDTNNATLPDGTGWPAESWRNAVAILSWCAVGLSGIMAVIFLFDACKCLAKCCSCCGGDDDDRRNKV